MDKKIIKFYKKKRILITGGTGFKGAWLAFFTLIKFKSLLHWFKT